MGFWKKCRLKLVFQKKYVVWLIRLILFSSYIPKIHIFFETARKICMNGDFFLLFLIFFEKNTDFFWKFEK